MNMKKLVIVIALLLFIMTGCSADNKQKELVNPIATIKFKDIDQTLKYELMINDAPQSVYNFVSLASADFYNGLSMHRIVTDFVAQGGDPDGTGAGGPGYSIKGEFAANNVKNPTSHTFGTLAFARSKAFDSAGSQFYIVTADYDEATLQNMDKNYAAFGKLLEGEELVKRINAEYSSKDGVPLKPLIIESITVDTLGQEIPQPTKLNK